MPVSSERPLMPGVPTSEPVIRYALEKRLRRFTRPAPVATPLIASEALKCARRVGFRMFGVPPDVPFTNAEKARFEDGDYIDSVAGEVLAIEKDARMQVAFNWLPLLALRGKADAGYRDERRVVVEVKSANEKGWSRAVGMWNNVPAAPKPEWLIQAGLGACSPTLRADMVHIVLVDNERFEVAEWVLDVDEPLDLPGWPVDVDWETGEVVLPTVRRMVLGELWRLAEILAECEVGTLPARVVPGFGLVLIPPSADEDRAEPWQCRFCPYQPSCARLPADAVADFGEIAS